MKTPLSWIIVSALCVLPACRSVPVGGPDIKRAYLSDSKLALRDEWLVPADTADNAIRSLHEFLVTRSMKRSRTGDFARHLLRSWDSYVCQVVGRTIEGRRIVHLNFVLNIPRCSEGWETEYISFFGGGDSRWQADIDAATFEVITYFKNSSE